MTESKIILKQLEALAHLDIDAIHAYSSAIDRIDLEDIKNQLISFRRDHERHVSDLAPCIERLGGKSPGQTPDFKGFFLQGFTAIRSMMSNEGALKAMKDNEELTNKTYAKALELEMPADIKQVVQKNFDDERRHLAYINQCIEARAWQRPEAA